MPVLLPAPLEHAGSAGAVSRGLCLLLHLPPLPGGCCRAACCVCFLAVLGAATQHAACALAAHWRAPAAALGLGGCVC